MLASHFGQTGQTFATGDFDELVRAMRAGATYVNVHTDARPAGEIRGQWVGAALNNEEGPVDWDTIAAVVEANFAETGQWFL